MSESFEQLPLGGEQQMSEDEKAKSTKKLPIRYLVYGLIAALLVTGVSIAGYVTAGSLAPRSARVAKFDVSVTHAGGWSVDHYNDVSSHGVGGNKVYTFTVTNHGEVPVRVRLHADRVSLQGQNPTVSPGGNFDLPIGGSQNVTVTVHGVAGGNAVRVFAEYVQID